MAVTQDTRSCDVCGVNLASGTASASLNSGTHYVCVPCGNVTDVNATLPTLVPIRTN